MSLADFHSQGKMGEAHRLKPYMYVTSTLYYYSDVAMSRTSIGQ